MGNITILLVYRHSGDMATRLGYRSKSLDSLFCPTSPCLVFTPVWSSSSLGVPTHPPPGAYEPTLGHTQFPDQVELVVLVWGVLKLGCPSRVELGMAPVEPGPHSLSDQQLWGRLCVSVLGLWEAQSTVAAFREAFLTSLRAPTDTLEKPEAQASKETKVPR